MKSTQWTTVAAHEMTTKLKNKSYIISTITTLAIMVAAIAFFSWTSGRTTEFTIATTSPQAAALAQQIEPNAEASGTSTDVTIREVDSDDEARSLVADEDADAWLHQENGAWVLTFQNSPDAQLVTYTQNAALNMTVAELAQQAGVSQESVAGSMSVSTSALDEGSASQSQIYVISAAFAILFLMSALTFGMQIAQSVTTEKASRLIEILAAAVPTRQLLIGKVIGNSVMALGQMALIVIVGLVGVSRTDLSTMLPGMNSAIVWFLVFFLAGFLALACLWAAAGALASTQEDLQSTSQPLTWLLMIAYLAGFMATGSVQTVLSYVPVISSILMPVRLAAGSSTWWQALISLGISLAFTMVAIGIGTMIYRRALLQVHGKVSLGQALRHESL